MINPPTPPSNGSNDRHQRVALALAGPFSDLDPPLLTTIEKALGVCLIVGIFRAYRAHRSNTLLTRTRSGLLLQKHVDFSSRPPGLPASLFQRRVFAAMRTVA
jgi:hypothetical protein